MDQGDFLSQLLDSLCQHTQVDQNIKLKPSCGKSHDVTPGIFVTNKPNGFDKIDGEIFEMSGLGIFNFGSSFESVEFLIFRFLANMFAI